MSSHTFVIESDSSGHRLSLDGAGIGTFPTLLGAETEAAHLVEAFAPHLTLRFELDFKWTLSDLEIRAATFTAPDRSEHMENSYVDR
jgi:hypothetical protein